MDIKKELVKKLEKDCEVILNQKLKSALDNSNESSYRNLVKALETNMELIEKYKEEINPSEFSLFFNDYLKNTKLLNDIYNSINYQFYHSISDNNSEERYFTDLNSKRGDGNTVGSILSLAKLCLNNSNIRVGYSYMLSRKDSNLYKILNYYMIDKTLIQKFDNYNITFCNNSKLDFISMQGRFEDNFRDKYDLVIFDFCESSYESLGEYIKQSIEDKKYNIKTSCFVISKNL